MAIGLICRHCGSRLKVPEKAAGKLGKCPKCNEVIRVPKAVTPEAHFCDRCEKTLAEEPNIHLMTGKIYCGPCFQKLQGKRKTGDSVLDQLDIKIPGMVVLRGKEQRDMGRMLKDVAAKKKFKDEDAAPGEPPPEAAKEPEKPTAPVLSASKDDEEGFLDEAPEEPKAAAPTAAPPKPEPPKVEAPEPAAPKVEEPEPEPAAPEPAAPEPAAPEPAAPEPAAPEPAAPEPAAPEEPEIEVSLPDPATLAKGQRLSDSLLIKLLVDAGVVLEGELELALQYQKGLGKRLIPVLDDLKLTSGDEIARVVSEKTGLELCPSGELEIAEDVFKLLEDEILRKYEVVPLSRDGDSVTVAFPNPLDAAAVKELNELLSSRVIPKVCAWAQYTGARRFLKSME